MDPCSSGSKKDTNFQIFGIDEESSCDWKQESQVPVVIKYDPKSNDLLYDEEESKIDKKDL